MAYKALKPFGLCPFQPLFLLLKLLTKIRHSRIPRSI
ncbi:unnamed protein product [Rhodiola kirilowii]